jgi:hypothetical protein
MKLAQLLTITGPVPLDILKEAQLSELQAALSLLGYPLGDVDGMIGPKTRNAWAEFKTDVFEGNPGLIGPESIAALRKKLDAIGGGKVYDFSTKEGTIAAIKAECRAHDIGMNTQIAYVLATTQWETSQTFKPVREAFWESEEWRKKHFRYYPYYGRGYVQLTWKNNYEKYSGLLGIDLVNNPDLAMDPKVALFVLVHGFKTGTFTGRKITDYISGSQTDFINARRCINGTDHASDIARLAEKFLHSL